MATFTARHFLYAATAVFALVQITGCGKNDSAALVASAQSYMAKADYKAAPIQLKGALQQAPDNAEARILLAKSLLAEGDPNSAETEVRKSIALSYPSDAAYPLLA